MKRQRAEISSNVISHIKSAHPIEMWRSNKLGIKEKISRGNVPRLIFSCPVPSGLPHRSHCVPMNMNPCGYRVLLELLGRFELPTSSLPTAVEPFSPCCTRLFGGFLSKKDEVTACLFHCFHPCVSPCGSWCGSKLLQLIKKRRQNIKYDRTDDCPVCILIMMHQPVPQSCDLHPRNIRILLLEVF